MHIKRLRGEVLGLRQEVANWGSATFRHWRPRLKRPGFAPAALNLAHYLALRRHDLRHLQATLMPLGLSSLGRAEGRVLASLDAVLASLGALSGEAAPGRAPTHRQLRRGEHRLARESAEVFGPGNPDRRGRILVTLASDAARDPQIVEGIVAAGVDAVRINCANDDVGHWARMLEHLRRAERRSGRRIPVLMDMAGSKVRTSDVVVAEGAERLGVGDELLLRRAGALPDPSAPFQLGCTLPEVLERLKVGHSFVIDDGKVRGTITREHEGNLVGRVTHAALKGYRLKGEKRLNFPGVELGLSVLTDRDLADLDFVAEHADVIGLSFVSTAADVTRVQDELARRRPDRRHALVLKVETRRAAHNLPDLIIQAAGRQPTAVMIARGSLALEVGFERLAQTQEEMLSVCEAASLPVIWVTQVLEGLVKKGVPSRGEMTDAAMAGRVECVMLNKGPNVLAGIEVLDAIMRRVAEHQDDETPVLGRLNVWT